MNKYIIALDMDGTLLNDDKKITFKTRRILTKLAKQGHIVMIASGRPYRAIKSYYESLKLSTPLICYNGSLTFSPNDESFKSIKDEFPKDVVLDIYNQVKPYSCNVMCEGDNDIWIDKKDSFLASFFWYEGMNIHQGDLNDVLNENPLTMIVHTPNGFTDQDKVNDIVKKYEGLSVRFWSGSPYFELFFSNVSKGHSIQRVAEFYNIPKERIIVFGDADNDFEMFDIAGISVAMANANPDLKKSATHIAKYDNNHNGIYYALKELNLF